jgi:hypothetical protein
VNLLESVQHEIDKMLAQEQIYEVLDYAWEDENTPSDSYIVTSDVASGRTLSA